MKNFLPTILGTAAIVIVQSSITFAQSISNVEKIAEQVTVKIETEDASGSGVIIGKQKDTYYVLTAKHVANNLVSEIITHDGESHVPDTNKVDKLPHLDLALVKFNSKKNYPIVTISDYNYQLYKNRDYNNNNFSEVTANQHVFVSGWPLEVEKRVFNPGVLFDNSGSAISVASSDSTSPETGYELVYTNLTHPGMSGGPVLDSKGRLIGIHGRADGQIINNDRIIQKYLDEFGISQANLDEVNNAEESRLKVGLSLGIPIQSFLNSQSSQAIKNTLKVENSAPASIAKPEIESWQPPIAIKNQANPFYWLEKGNQLWRIGRVAEARGAFQKAIDESKGKFYLAWFAKGFAAGFDRKYDDALKSCDRAIKILEELKPSIPPQDFPKFYPYYEAYRCKAGALQELQQYEPALVALDRALKINPDNPSDWFTQGELRFALNQYSEALKSYDKAIEIRKKYNLAESALLYNNRGLVLFSLEKYELALKDIEKAIKIDSNYAPAWSNKGLVLQALNRNEDSLAAFDKSVELSPSDYNTWTNRGFTLYQMNRPQEAKESFEKALQINPKYQPAIDNLEELKTEVDR